MSKPALNAARHSTTVAMPRFRRAQASSTRLSEVVNRALTRAFGNAGPFGIFLMDRKCQFVGIKTAHFTYLEKNKSAVLIGIYDKSVRVADLTDDLSEFFTDGDA